MTSRRLWVPLLAGLLVAGMLGVAGGGAAAVEPRATTASIMIPAAAFIPASDDSDYINNGRVLFLGAGTATFTAPVSFPAPVVSIKRITLYAYDNDAGQVCASLYRSRPLEATEDYAGGICTGNSAAEPQTVYTTAINPKQVNTTLHGPYLWVTLFDPTVRFFAVKVTYSY